MIVSHRHKFIFLKPRKVAGTSVEVALSRHCGGDDILTPIGAYDSRWDEDQYVHPGRKWPGLKRHATVQEIRRVIGEDIWRRYYKFSIVRNPWDLVVSQYHWAIRKQSLDLSISEGLVRFARRPNKLRRNLTRLGWSIARKFLPINEMPFKVFATYLLRYYQPNDAFYFGPGGALALDHILRYEDLDRDFQALCGEMGLPETPLPALKTKTRPKDRHYTDYYDTGTRDRVARFHRRHIEDFGYTFE